MILNSEKWSCGVYERSAGKLCQVHSMYEVAFTSGAVVKGVALLLVIHGFTYKRCDGTIQEYYLDEDLVVDGETYECVKSFCYLGDTLDGDGGVDLAATARIRNGWMKFPELLPFLTSRAPPLEMKGGVYASCVRGSMTYGSETRPLQASVGLRRDADD